MEEKTMTTEIKRAFAAIGADVEVETKGLVFEIDVRRIGEREVYQPGRHRRKTDRRDEACAMVSVVQWFCTAGCEPAPLRGVDDAFPKSTLPTLLVFTFVVAA
jgi:hypothetical protein